MPRVTWVRAVLEVWAEPSPGPMHPPVRMSSLRGPDSHPEVPAHTQSVRMRLAARRGLTLLDKDSFFPPWSGGAEGAPWMHKHGQEGRPPESFQKPLSDK